MAYRDSVVTVSGGVSVAAVMPSFQTGDYIGVIITQGGFLQTVTPPAGWTQRSNGDITGPSGETFRYYDLDGGAIVGTTAPTYTWSSDGGTGVSAIAFSLSNRTISRSFVTNTSNASANLSPVSISAAGGTASSGDDLVFSAGANFITNSDTWSYGTVSGSPGSLTTRQTGSISGGGVAFNLATLDSISAGATGSLAVTLTETSGTDGAGWSAFVVAIPAGGPTITVQPQNASTFVGNTATFTVTATGTGTLHYQWKKNGSNVGTDSSSYTTPTLDMTYNGSIYTVDVSDDNGTKTSNGALLTVYIVAAVAWIRA